MRNAAGSVDALRLETGAPWWRAPVDAQPIAVADQALVASRPVEGAPNALDILVLSLPEKGTGLRTCRVEFPEGTAVASGDRRDFEFSPALDGRVLRLEWTARSRYRGGAPPPDGLSAAARGESRGVVRCDLDTCAVTIEDARHAAATPLPPSHPYRIRSVWSEEAWIHGEDVVSRLVVTGPAGSRKLVLESQPPRAQGSRTTDLMSGEAFEAHVTPDGGFVFARVTRPQRATEWVVFATGDGVRVASLPDEDGFVWPCVLDDRVYYLAQSLVLTAADLSLARVRWRYDLGAPTRGPAPLAR